LKGDGGTQRDPRVDEIDEKIISLLKEDGRKPLVEVAKVVNLSEAAVRRRVSNLTKSGVIAKFTLETSIGTQARAICMVSVSPNFPTADLSARFRHVKGIDSIFEITGEYDIAVIISGSNIAEINKIIDDIRKSQGVHDTNTVMILRTVR
jgi:DNA-binding Lrp family transcriptional regulator